MCSFFASHLVVVVVDVVVTVVVVVVVIVCVAHQLHLPSGSLEDPDPLFSYPLLTKNFFKRFFFQPKKPRWQPRCSEQLNCFLPLLFFRLFFQ